MVAGVPLEGEDPDRRGPGHLAAPGYQPRSASRVSTEPASCPLMASPSPALTLATTVGSSWWVVAWYLAQTAVLCLARRERQST